MFDCAWRTMPRPMPVSPLMRSELVRLGRPEDHVGHVADARRAVDADRLDLLAACDAGIGAHQKRLVVAREAAGRRVERDGARAPSRDRRRSGRARRARSGRSARGPAARGRRSASRRRRPRPRRAGRRCSSSTSCVRSWIGMSLRGDGEPDDGVGIVVGLDDRDVLDVVGQLALDIADRVAEVVGGDVEVDRIVELDDDAALAGAARRGDRLHARHARRRRFRGCR